MGRLSGEASTNTLVNLFASRALPESYAISQEPALNEETQDNSETPSTINEAFADT